MMKQKKVLKSIMITTGLLGLSVAFSDFIFKIYLKNRLNMDFSTREASSVAIIGGADGPTAIFLAARPHSFYKYILAILLFSVSIGCLLAIRRNKTTES